MPPRKKKPVNGDPLPDDTATKTDTVRVESDIAEMATIVAIRRKTSVSKLISPMLRTFIEAEYAKEVRAMSKDLT